MENKSLRKSKTVKLTELTISKIEKRAKKEKRTTHYLMVQALEEAFK